MLEEVYEQHYAIARPTPQAPVAAFPLSARLASRRFPRDAVSVMAKRPATGAVSRVSQQTRDLLQPHRRQAATSSSPAQSSPLSRRSESPWDQERRVLPTGDEAVGTICVTGAPRSVRYEAPTMYASLSEVREQPRHAAASVVTPRPPSGGALATQRHLSQLASRASTRVEVAEQDPDSAPPSPKSAAMRKEDLEKELYAKHLRLETQRASSARPLFRTSALKTRLFGTPPGEEEPEFEHNIRQDEFYYAKRLAAAETHRARAAIDERAATIRRANMKQRIVNLERSLSLKEPSALRRAQATLHAAGVIDAAATVNSVVTMLRSKRNLPVDAAAPTPRQMHEMELISFDRTAKRPTHGRLLSQGTRDVLADVGAKWERPPKVRLSCAERDGLDDRRYLDRQREEFDAAIGDV
jgi:hypothetical protein